MWWGLLQLRDVTDLLLFRPLNWSFGANQFSGWPDVESQQAAIEGGTPGLRFPGPLRWRLVITTEHILIAARHPAVLRGQAVRHLGQTPCGSVPHDRVRSETRRVPSAPPSRFERSPAAPFPPRSCFVLAGAGAPRRPGLAVPVYRGGPPLGMNAGGATSIVVSPFSSPRMKRSMVAVTSGETMKRL